MREHDCSPYYAHGQRHATIGTPAISSAPVCLRVWGADVALCLLLRRIANYRCIGQQRNKLG